MRRKGQFPDMGPKEQPLDGATDRDLVIAFQSGTQEAYDELYRRYIGRVRHVCRRFLHDPQDAEEAAQETFLRSFQALARFNGQYQVGAWLARIASNVCVDEIRSKHRHFHVVDLGDDDVEELEGGNRPDSSVPDKMELASTLQSITPLHARALMLRTLEGLSHQEIAGELKMTPGQVKALLHRARTSFRRVWRNASGWALAPLGGLRSLITERPRETAAAGDGAAAGLISPAGHVLLEKVAASAVAAALAFSGVPTAPSNESEDDGAPRSHFAAERAGKIDAGAPRTSIAAGAVVRSGVEPGAKDGLARMLLSAQETIEETIEEEPEEPEPEDDRDSGEPTTGPTVSTKPAKDKAKEARDKVDEVTPDLP